jgi:hypothetical protein
MRKLASLLICLCLIWPTAIKAAETTSIILTNPGSDKKTAVSVVFPKGTAWEKGDLITIVFDTKENTPINLPSPECLYSPDSQRRFNPGPKFTQACKDNPYPSITSKIYKLTMDSSFQAEWPKDLQDAWIPGFLMPIMPSDIEKAKAKFDSLIELVTINGLPCRPEKGTQIVSTAERRSITVVVSKPVEMMKELVISMPDLFGIVCPNSQGTYEIKVESKANASTSIEVVKPELINPKLSVLPEFPGEPSKWSFEFNLSKAGAMNTSNNFILKMLQGFAKLQETYPDFQIYINGTQVQKTNYRLISSAGFDQILIVSPITLERSSKVNLELSIINPDEGDYECYLSTSSDSIPVKFNPANIKFVQGSTLADTTAGLATSLTARLKSNGHVSGEAVLVVLPSEINENCKVTVNGKQVISPNFGAKTVQFELPTEVKSGSICRFYLSNVTNPLTSETIKVTIGNQSYSIPWNVTPYQQKVVINTYPPVANKPCSYFFRITPPPDLLEEERKQVIIDGPWNKIIHPNTKEVLLQVKGNIIKANLNPNGTVTINLPEPFPNMKPLVVEIPQSAGFGSPHSSSEFTVTIAGKTIKSICSVQPGPPAVAYKITSISGKDINHVENQWFNEPVTIQVFTSSGKSNISLTGIPDVKNTEKSDLETTINTSIVTEELKAIVYDEGGKTEVILPTVKIDLSELSLKTTNPFEKTGVCPTQNLIIGIETNKKIIPKGKEFMVVEPEISVWVNGISESVRNLVTKIESEKPDSKLVTDISTMLKYETNEIKVRATDQTGRYIDSSFTLKLNLRPVTLELEGSQNMVVDPGIGKEIVFITEPEAQVFLGENNLKADSSGKVKAKLDIVPGYNEFLTQIITKENVSYEMQVYIIGRRIIRMKSEQKFMTVDGKKIDLKVPPTTVTYKFKEGGKGNKYIQLPVAYVPLRVLAENLFSSVSYDSATQTATIIQKRPDKKWKIELKVNNTFATVNGEIVPINKDYPVPTIIKNGSVMLPLRFASEQLGSSVGYDGKTKEIIITWPGEKTQPAKPETTPGTGKKP